MQTIEGFDFFHLRFDGDGALQSAPELEQMKTHVNATGATDAVFIAHGFRNDEADATSLYSGFLNTFRAHCARPEFQASIGGRRIVVAGVFWPSKSFRESFNDDDAGGVQSIGDDADGVAEIEAQLKDMRDDETRPAARKALDQALALLPTLARDPHAQDEFVQKVLSTLDGSELDANEGLEDIRSQSGSDLLAKLGTPIFLPTTKDDDDDEGGGMSFSGAGSAGEGGAQSIGSFFGSIAGRVGQFLNLTTWYQMKDRAGKVGASGAAQAVRAVKASRPGLKIHLVGHSLGGRLMAACAKSLCTGPQLQPDSLTLLEAAFSHYGFSPDNGKGTAGFFRDVVAQSIVKGPLISTFSFQDTVVGKAYAVASRLAGDNTKFIGGPKDPFGGIGRNGTQKTKEATNETLHTPGSGYIFPPKVVHNLDGSGGLIKDHGDVTNTTVTYAFASALSQT